MTHNTDAFNLDAETKKLNDSIDQLILERDQWKAKFLAEQAQRFQWQAKAEYWEGELSAGAESIGRLIDAWNPHNLGQNAFPNTPKNHSYCSGFQDGLRRAVDELEAHT